MSTSQTKIIENRCCRTDAGIDIICKTPTPTCC